MSELDMTDAIAGLEETTRLRIIQKAVVNFEESETEQNPQIPMWVEGVLQSIHPRALLVKPEGQRSWTWREFWCSEKLELDWVLQSAQGVRFRVMSRSDWSQAEYYVYELVEGNTP